ncbi:MAG: Nif3-like dinuclear metal center hexameric protein, partial [Clostridia bacterium]|nr:Nif3-like dinuclear metal center hexameric protein [Clostridia bacterium]
DEDMFDLLRNSGCDIIITSEIKHNLAVQCSCQGMCAVEITHFDSEKHSIQLLEGILRRAGIDAIAAKSVSPYSKVI